jgi:hypothetical protein
MFYNVIGEATPEICFSWKRRTDFNILEITLGV